MSKKCEFTISNQDQQIHDPSSICTDNSPDMHAAFSGRCQVQNYEMGTNELYFKFSS